MLVLARVLAFYETTQTYISFPDNRLKNARDVTARIRRFTKKCHYSFWASGVMDEKNGSIEQILQMLTELSGDRKVPRNVRCVITDAIRELKKTDDNITAKVNTTISLLDEVSNDPNIQGYTRTQIWNVVSLLESVCSEE